MTTESTANAAVRLRNQPVQARSSARIESLLDATAAIVDEIGYERLTTAHVAERAGASIGTLYRYYPDRLAVLYALRERLVRRLLERIDQTIELSKAPALEEWVSSIVDVYVDLYRTEPGFRAVRFGDIVDDSVQGVAGSNDGQVAAHLTAKWLAVETNQPRDVEHITFTLEVSVEIARGLVDRAFTRGIENPDQRFIAVAKQLAAAQLAQSLPELA